MVRSDTIIRDDSQARSAPPLPSLNTVFLFCNTNNNPLHFCSTGCQGEAWAALQTGRHQSCGQNTSLFLQVKTRKVKKLPGIAQQGPESACTWIHLNQQ